MFAFAQDPMPVDTVYTEETFRFLAAPELWQVALLIVPAVVLFVWWSYGGLKRLEPRARYTMMAVRGLTITILLLALFQPATEQVRYTSVQTQVHIVVDDSASMQRHDTYPDDGLRAGLESASGVADLASASRSELAAKVLGQPGGLFEKLGENHDVRLFRFTREPRLIRDFGELTAKGPRTHIGDALHLLRSSPAAVNLDAVILVSDGRNNGGLPPVEVAQKYRASDVPIYTIGVGDPNPPHNVRLVGPPGPQEALKNEDVVFEVTVSAEGMAGRDLNVTLHGARNGGPYVPLAQESAVLAEDGQPVKVRLYHAFAESGDYSLRFEATPFPEETSHEDNRATRFLRVSDQQIRVLYLEDLPRWEYRYVKNALLRVDPSIEVQVYLFDASRDFQQESTRGLPPLRALPRSRAELFKYHVILIGDVAPERLGTTDEQRTAWLEQLVEFVEFGGGVGFLFGEIAMPERYRGTPLEDLLPVVLEDRAELGRIDVDRISGFVPQLDNPIRPHEITLLRRDPAANARLWHDELSPLTVYYPVNKAKAGAEVLLRHPEASNRYGKRVLAAASVYPRGRTFFMGTDETWRWRYLFGDHFQDLFWRNVVRYLASGKLRRRDDKLELRLDKVIVETGEQVRVYLEVRDDEFQPTQAAEFPVFFRRPDQEPEKRILRAVPGEPGNYQGTFTMDRSGSVSVMVFENDNSAGEVLAREDVLVKVPDREMANSSQDRETLENIAKASKGGRYLFLADANELWSDFDERSSYEHEVDRKTRPLWDTIWVLLLALTLLGVEWSLRKYYRLI